LQPSQPLAVRAEAGTGVKIRTRGEDHAAALVAVRIERNNGIGGFPIAGMILPHRDEPGALWIKDHIGVAQWAFRRDRPRRIVAIDAVEPGVGEVREDEHAVAHHVRASTVLVDAGTSIESTWNGIGDRSVRGTTHDHRAPGLRRPVLDPVDVVPIDARAYDANALPRDEVGGDRRPPGAVGSDFGG
jgi:hypothetical protein